MMTERFAIDCHDRDRRSATGDRSIDARSGSPITDLTCEAVGVLEQVAERHLVRQGPVIRDQLYLVPIPLPRHRGTGASRRRHLMRRQDREADTLFGEHGQCLVIHRRLGQPHTEGFPPKKPTELTHSPAHLRLLVATGSERQDHMMERGGNGRTVAGAINGGPIACDHARQDVRRVSLEPVHEGGAHVEGEPLPAVDHLPDPASIVEDWCRAQWCVALAGDPDIPVVIGRGAGFAGHQFEPGFFPRRLIAVRVHHQPLLRAHVAGTSDAAAIAPINEGNGASSSCRRAASASAPARSPEPDSRAGSSDSSASQCSLKRLVA